MNTYPFTREDSERAYAAGYAEGRVWRDNEGEALARDFATSLRESLAGIPESAPRTRRRIQGRIVGLLTSADAEASQDRRNRDVAAALEAIGVR